jgi:acetate kinase
MSILVINAGSTSLKFGLFDAGARETLVSGSIDWADGNRRQARFLLRRGS